MRLLVAAALAVFLVAFVATTLVRSSTYEERARRYFTAEEVARGQRRSLEARLLFWAGMLFQLAFLSALTLTGPGRRLAEACKAVTGQRTLLAVLLLGAVIFLLESVLAFPLSAYAGWAHPRAWGLTDRGFGSWLSDYLKGFAVSAVIGGALTLGLYALILWLKQRWWLAAGLGSGAFAVLMAFVLPVLVAPLFNTFTPISRTKQAALEPRLRELVARGGVPVAEVLVMDASRQGRHTNAYFTGFGPTRRIVLYDTLLDSHPPAEVESILGHEVGHWRHDHIVKGIVLGTLAALAGFLVLARILEARPLGLAGPADPAGLPLVLLLAFLGGFASMPAQNAVSRHFEREADRASLQIAGQPEAFVEGEKRLVRDNIGNPAPTPLTVWLFATHPPAVERIEMAEAWRTDPGGP